MRKFWITLWNCIWPVGVYLAIQAAVSALFYSRIAVSSDAEAAELTTKYGLRLTALSAILAIPFLAAVNLNDRRKNRIEFGKDRSLETPVMTYVVGILGAAGLSIVLNILISAAGLVDTDSAFHDVNSIIMAADVPEQFLATCILAPLAEELLFRGILFRRIRRCYGAPAGIFVSALAFGFFHGNLTQGLYAAGLGICLAWAYQETEAFLLPVLIHAFVNAASLFLYMLNPDGSGNMEGIVLIAVCLALSILFVVFFGKLTKQNKWRKERMLYETSQYHDTLL